MKKESYKIIKDKKGNTKGISIKAKKIKNPKTIDDIFSNIFSKYIRFD